MTETGITHTPPLGRSKPGYVGDSIDGVETRIAPNGEVLVRSPMNMAGYFRNPEATRDCFTEEGFFRTGDLGELDDEGWLRIIGRVKEQFKTSKGKYISPNPIEKVLSASPLIEACCVMGSQTPQPFALLIPTQDAREAIKQQDGRVRVEEELKQLMLTVNAQLDPHERLQFLVVSDEYWTVANGLLTPTLKLKRGLLESRYQAMFEIWGRGRSPVIWHLTDQDASAAQQGGS
jgi:long-chain acyl-CoA synthetase